MTNIHPYVNSLDEPHVSIPVAELMRLRRQLVECLDILSDVTAELESRYEDFDEMGREWIAIYMAAKEAMGEA